MKINASCINLYDEFTNLLLNSDQLLLKKMAGLIFG